MNDKQRLDFLLEKQYEGNLSVSEQVELSELMDKVSSEIFEKLKKSAEALFEDD